ncbi:hypothetical protein THAOC_28801, partial [Thalassiosira oceanica]
VDNIKEMFMAGVATKEQFAEALKAYQDAVEEMKRVEFFGIALPKGIDIFSLDINHELTSRSVCQTALPLNLMKRIITMGAFLFVPLEQSLPRPFCTQNPAGEDLIGRLQDTACGHRVDSTTSLPFGRYRSRRQRAEFVWSKQIK